MPVVRVRKNNITETVFGTLNGQLDKNAWLACVKPIIIANANADEYLFLFIPCCLYGYMWRQHMGAVAIPSCQDANARFFDGRPVFTWEYDSLCVNTDLLQPPPVVGAVVGQAVVTGGAPMVQMSPAEYQAYMAAQQQQPQQQYMYQPQQPVYQQQPQYQQQYMYQPQQPVYQQQPQYQQQAPIVYATATAVPSAPPNVYYKQ